MTNSELSLEHQVGQLLIARGLTVATAESCTGGLLGHLLTNVSGSSAYFLGGVLSYANEIKERVLDVPLEILETQGAVSAECAEAMAVGVRRFIGTDIGLSTTGIAGPTGGTLGKPVGLVYIGLSAPDYNTVQRFVWNADRIGNKELSAQAALQMLTTYLRMKDE